MNKNQQIAFLKKMYILLRAGISLEDCFTSQAQYGSERIRTSMTTAVQLLQQGTALSEIFKNHFKYDPLTYSLITAGEHSGTLKENIFYASETLAKQQKLQQTIISSLFYPLIIGCMTLVLSGFLLFVIFPKIQPLFRTFKTALPWSTQFLIYLSTFLVHYGIYILSGSIFCTVLYRFLHKKYAHIKKIQDSIFLKTPSIKSFIILYQSARITRSIGVMLKGGLPLDAAVRLTNTTLFNSQYKHMLLSVYIDLHQGKSFSQSCKRFTHLIPQETYTLLATAEMAGTLPETCIYCAELLDEQVESLSKAYSRMLEPLLMIVMGLIVGFVALSMLTPLYSITQNIKH
ncbi:MAG: type II secretion system F family protein [Patescibacteria group bacterium]